MTDLLSPVIRTLADLVRINSVNPAYPGAGSELPMADAVCNFFAGYPVEIWRQQVFPGRPNVIVCLPGRDRQRLVILEAHTDTVSTEGMTIAPFEPTVSDGKLYGRGACDTKAGLAAMMHAVATLARGNQPPGCDIWLAATVDEEFSYRGVVKLCEGLQADAAIVAEPTELRVIVASKGVLRWPIAVHGVAAHSSKPHLGNNAISQMAKLIAQLDQYHLTLAQQSHPLLGPATANIGIIRGGTQVNFVPDRCVIEIDRRLLPGESVDDVLEGYRRLIADLSLQDATFRGEVLSPLLIDQPLDTDPNTEVVRLARSVAADLGLNSQIGGVPFGSDASKLAAIGIPSIVFGPGSIDRAHAAGEYVEIDQVDQAYEFYLQFLSHFPQPR